MELRTLTEYEVYAARASLLELQRAAYAAEAELIGDNRIPPLHESADELTALPLTWIVATEGGEIAGAIAYAVDGGVVDLDRLMVSPSQHRKGIGRKLVVSASHAAPAAVVSTGKENHPARSLYESLGFEHQADHEVLPGLWISRYSRLSRES